MPGVVYFRAWVAREFSLIRVAIDVGRDNLVCRCFMCWCFELFQPFSLHPVDEPTIETMPFAICPTEISVLMAQEIRNK